MPVPKRKRSRARRDKRFANKGMQVKTLASCQNCQQAVQMHAACSSCGFYKGRKILVTKAEHLERKTLARKEKADRAPAAPAEVTEPTDKKSK